MLVASTPMPLVESQFPVPELPKLHNWAGNVVFEANNLRTPFSIGELQHAIQRAHHVRPLLVEESIGEP